ncbi:PD-(D/E)XK nuclease family transposase [Olivibacter domesticus]|uniref:PD-(D/E)XK nuclease family transposase n=1 Tax=Olivibacter domesticus TaxID=407022 RepID=A0A1H7JSV0_OLID1|nr:PD-(D/E)XK nuclease family transposase [Olivibacter domesticus]SEK77659.1 PD-(D/E)XK nuclease family transposase [Olivibacter domesticus]
MTKTTYPQAGKFIDPLSDWGFRHYFGSEPNKEILIGFLNDLFEGEKYIEDLEYGPTEQFYLLKHMSNMDKIPKFLDKRVFKLIFKIGEVSKLKKEERMAYESSLKAKWDTQNAFDYAIKKAQEEEHAKAEAEKLKSANSLKKAGVSSQIIAESLNLPLEVIEKL